MRGSPPRRAAVALLLLVTLAGSASATVHDPPDEGPIAGRPHHALAISGRVRGLFPGASRPMKVTVWNTHDQDLRITSLQAITTAGHTGCPASALKVKPLRSTPVVPAGGHIRVRMRALLDPAAPDACQGLRFVVVFRATAVAP